MDIDERIAHFEQLCAETAAIRAAWESGNMRAFLDAVIASRSWPTGAHGTNQCGSLWATAMTLCHRDRPDYDLWDAERRAPNLIHSQELDNERWASDHGLLCSIEYKELYLYRARQHAA